MNLDCSILLEDKQRFKSGGVMCVDCIHLFSMFWRTFTYFVHALSMHFRTSSFAFSIFALLFRDMLLCIFCTQESYLVKDLWSWPDLQANQRRKAPSLCATRPCHGGLPRPCEDHPPCGYSRKGSGLGRVSFTRPCQVLKPTGARPCTPHDLACPQELKQCTIV